MATEKQWTVLPLSQVFHHGFHCIIIMEYWRDRQRKQEGGKNLVSLLLIGQINQEALCSLYTIMQSRICKQFLKASVNY